MKRDAKKVYTAITVKGEELIALKPMSIQFPKRFVQAGFAILGNPTILLGKVAWIYDGAYAVSSLCAPFRTEPTSIKEVTVGDETYMQLDYDPGARVMININLVQMNQLMYEINHEFVDKGKLPWYIDYDEIGGLFKDSKYHASMTVGANLGVMHIIYATIFRDQKNKRTYYRQTLKSRDDLATKTPAIIPMRTVSYGATNTIAKLLGSYFDENVTGALVNPAERLDDIDKLLRA
jgi:hypothetical protein